VRLGCREELFRPACGLACGVPLVTPRLGENDILNPDDRNQTELTALLPVTRAQTLRITGATVWTREDCTSKVASAIWTVTDPSVLRLDVAPDAHSATLVGLSPGDTQVFADLTFNDGSFPMRVLPWSFTHVGSGTITVVRVVP
jgi:hypothetical protein